MDEAVAIAVRDSATIFLGVLSRFVYCITFVYAMPTPCSTISTAATIITARKMMRSILLLR